MSDYDSRSIRDNLVLVGWVFAWMAALTVADKAALYGWWSAEWLTFLAIAVHVLIGIGMVFKFMAMLRNMDDLQRRIQLEALSMALGISLVGCAAYSLLVTWGYIVDEEVSDIFMLMCVSYSVSVLLGVWRYR
ncbi:MAG: hypothetical protein R3308_08480 [Thiohalobacterales bacterium]|nr:hypothetical protein [Thiohalobacterales bacterium]